MITDEQILNFSKEIEGVQWLFNSYSEELGIKLFHSLFNKPYFNTARECVKQADGTYEIRNKYNITKRISGQTIFNIAEKYNGKLNKEKVYNLGQKLGLPVPKEDMALCDVYNYRDTNIVNSSSSKKVGFM